MNCAEMRDRLEGLPGDFRKEEFSPAERDHLDSCEACRMLARDQHSLRERIAAAGGVPPPGDAYWNTILPRVQRLTTRHPLSDRMAEWFGSARFVMQGAALAVTVLFLLMVNITAPPVPGREVSVSELSGVELLDLRSSSRYTGLLDHSGDPEEGDGATIVDFLTELLTTDDGSALYATVDPIAVIGGADDESFGEIVDILKSNK